MDITYYQNVMDRLIAYANHQSEYNDTELTFIEIPNPELLPGFTSFPDDYKWLLKNYGLFVWGFHGCLVLEVFDPNTSNELFSWTAVKDGYEDEDRCSPNKLTVGYDVHAAVYVYEINPNGSILKEYYCSNAVFNNIFELIEANLNNLRPFFEEI